MKEREKEIVTQSEKLREVKRRDGNKENKRTKRADEKKIYK